MSLPLPNECTNCDSDRLMRYLESGLSARDQETLERHLNDCEPCQRKLEGLAADGEFWRSASEALEANASPAGQRTSDSEWSHLSLDVLANRAVNSHCDTLDVDLASSDTVTSTALSQKELLERWLDPSDRPGSLGRLGKYEVQGIVGQGGMGLVLKALDTELHRLVALKTLAHHISPQRTASGTEASLRLAREARAVAALRHPNIIAIYSLET